MKDVTQYIKRIIALGVCTGIFFLLIINLPETFEWYYVLPVVLLGFSLIVSRINNEKPTELFDYNRSDKFFSKGGLRELLKIFVSLFGFLYDIVVWTVWGVIYVFLVLTDIVFLLKVIGYWIFFAIVWFLKLYVPFWRLFLYNGIHYLIKWPWWIYRNSFKNVKYTYNKNVYRIAFLGSLVALFIFQVFYYLEIAIDIPKLRYMGVVLSLLPITWVFGEISSIRAEKLIKEKWYKITANYGNGMENVRSTLIFMGFLLVLIGLQWGFNWLGSVIKNSGITFSSFTINLNVVSSFLMLAYIVVLWFTILILPSYRIFNSFDEISIQSTWKFLKKSLSNILHYFSFIVPAGFFSAIVAIIPVVIVGAALWLTISIKDNITQIRINKLQAKTYDLSNELAKYQLQKQIDDLQYIKNLETINTNSFNIVSDIKNKKGLISNIYKTEQKILSESDTYAIQIDQKTKEIEDINSSIEEAKQKSFINNEYIESLQNQLALAQNEEINLRSKRRTEIEKLNIDLAYLQKHKTQLPLIFYFLTLLIIVCGTPILAAILAYLGNVLYDVYIFRNDSRTPFIQKSIQDENQLTASQPLLSTTLNALSIFVILYVLMVNGI